MQNIEIDIRGQVCPSTLLSALKEINGRSGELRDKSVTLSFLTDNRDAVVTIPESASNMGYAVSVIKRDGYYVIEVRKD
ncbi:MAG TPA: sulfurtransferase TusA family protein [Thermodesulfovibrionales bacterium]|nr:sulfurtransferase TusA family protein [Thermodesulfovibrionales bacterium]